MKEKFNSYAEFWPFYLQEHSNPKTRALHFAGTAAGILTAAFTAAVNPALLPLALVPSYGAAWAAHHFIEKNKPATFIHPAWSFVSDFRMAALWCTGQLENTYKKHGRKYRPD